MFFKLWDPQWDVFIPSMYPVFKGQGPSFFFLSRHRMWSGTADREGEGVCGRQSEVYPSSFYIYRKAWLGCLMTCCWLPTSFQIFRMKSEWRRWRRLNPQLYQITYFENVCCVLNSDSGLVSHLWSGTWSKLLCLVFICVMVVLPMPVFLTGLLWRSNALGMGKCFETFSTPNRWKQAFSCSFKKS